MIHFGKTKFSFYLEIPSFLEILQFREIKRGEGEIPFDSMWH